MDASYGTNSALRAGVSALALSYHATLCIAIYGFLISERKTIPPSGPGSFRRLEVLALPAGYRPRGAANPAAAARPGLDRDGWKKRTRGGSLLRA
jgi:hypothetical protein